MNLPKDGTNQLPKAGFDWILTIIVNLFNICLVIVFSILAWSFPRMVSMNCEEKDLIELLYM